MKQSSKKSMEVGWEGLFSKGMRKEESGPRGAMWENSIPG